MKLKKNVIVIGAISVLCLGYGIQKLASNNIRKPEELSYEISKNYQIVDDKNEQIIGSSLINENEKKYVVQSGDSIYRISRKLNQDMNDLLDENPNIRKNGKIAKGDEIIVRTNAIISYKVHEGDTLVKIADKFNISIDDLVKINDLDKDIFKDQVIYIKNGNAKKIGAPRSTTKSQDNESSSKLQWPMSTSTKTSGFGYRTHPISKSKKLHEGVDFEASVGTSVKAAQDGVVSYSGWMNGYGYIVIIKHDDGIETRYAHLSKTLVSKGDDVSQGEVIAKSGNTGRSTGPHLHYEVRVDGVAKNPENFH